MCFCISATLRQPPMAAQSCNTEGWAYDLHAKLVVSLAYHKKEPKLSGEAKLGSHTSLTFSEGRHTAPQNAWFRQPWLAQTSNILKLSWLTPHQPPLSCQPSHVTIMNSKRGLLMQSCGCQYTMGIGWFKMVVIHSKMWIRIDVLLNTFSTPDLYFD